MRIINIHIVNDLGGDSIGGSVADVPNAWPGVATDVDITDPPEIRAIWIGVSADGSDNQIFPPTATPAQIIAAGWLRVYQGTELFYVEGSVVVVSEPIKTMQILLAACCATQIETAALVLKQSSYTLKPLAEGGTQPPCGADAIFTLIAIKGTNESRTMGLDIYVQPYSADGNIGLNYHLILPIDINGLVPFTETVSISKKWPDDFIGWVDDNGSKIVANDVVPGPNEYNASAFDNGGITLVCVIYEIVSPEQFVIISNALADFWLPGTDCD